MKGKLRAYVIGGDVYCGCCAENIGGSFVDHYVMIYNFRCNHCQPDPVREVLISENERLKNKLKEAHCTCGDAMGLSPRVCPAHSYLFRES